MSQQARAGVSCDMWPPAIFSEEPAVHHAIQPIAIAIAIPVAVAIAIAVAIAFASRLLMADTRCLVRHVTPLHVRILILRSHASRWYLDE